MQKISSIYKIILMILTILKILGSHELNDNAHPKTIEITFSFPEFARAYKKSVHSMTIEPHMRICINIQKISLFQRFVLERRLIQKSCDLIG